MPGRNCYFFADESDLLDLLRGFMDLGHHKYVQMRSRLNEACDVHENPLAILEEAMVSPQKPIRTHTFLVVERNHAIHQREIVMADGSGVIKVADQNNNFDSVVLAFGGNAGDHTLIMSDINTVGDTDSAVEMHKNFRKIVFSNSQRAGPKGSPCRLMPGAVEKAKKGWRLASGKDWSHETDTQLSEEDIRSL